jgi:hypothetical protein
MSRHGRPSPKILLAILAVAALSIPGVHLYFTYVANPRVEREILEDPNGERARRVMLLTLPSGRRIPVNYLREGGRVFAAADGRWWTELDGEGFPVRVHIRGADLAGRARAVRDDPDYTHQVFAKLRPDAVEGFGTLIEIRLEPAEAAPWRGAEIPVYSAPRRASEL